jgi:hypothetical protein
MAEKPRTTGGEKPRTIGAEAEKKAWKFLDALGYRILETNNEEYDIDCLAEFPPKITKFGLSKPCYAPEGFTAFEVTEENLNRRKINAFSEKILRYNRAHPQSSINGGVILVDQRISLPLTQFMERLKIWGWDRSRGKLYREKIRTFSTWRSVYKSATELSLDKNVSYIRSSTPPPTSSEKLLYFALFFDDSLHKITTKTIVDAMNRIKAESITPAINCGIRPVNTYFTFYSIGGLSENLREEIWKGIIEPWKAEEIIVFTEMEPFNDYRTLPTLTME